MCCQHFEALFIESRFKLTLPSDNKFLITGWVLKFHSLFIDHDSIIVAVTTTNKNLVALPMIKVHV